MMYVVAKLRTHRAVVALLITVLGIVLLGASSSEAQPAAGSWAGTVTVTETFVVSTPDRSINKNASYTLRITGPGDAATPHLLHAEVVTYSIKYSESSIGPICSGFDEYLQGQIIGPRPANPPFPYIGVQVEFGATGTTYTLRTTGVTDSGTLIHTVMGPPALCGTSSTAPFNMFIESVFGTGDQPLPADGKTFKGTYQVNLPPPQQVNVEWNLVFSPEPKADLEVAKIARMPPPRPGGFIEYDLVVTNHGPDAATNVQLVDAIGTGLEFLQVFSSDQATCFASTATCTLSNLASGASFTAMVSALTRVDATSVANGASVSSAATDLVSANNSVTVVTPLGTGSCRGVNGGIVTPTYKASIAVPGPDAHLYTFSATVTYCYDGTIAEVLNAAAFGTDDPGFDMGLLSVLGLDFNYLPGPPNESVTVSGSRADISGVFEASVNLATLVELVFPIGGKVTERLAKEYAKELAKILNRYGADLAQLERRMVDSTKTLQSNIEKEISAAFKKLNKVLPDGMTNAIRDKMLAAVRAAFNAWLDATRIQAMLEQLIGMGAEQFADVIFADMREILRELVTVHVEQWFPHIVVQVFPDGNVIISQIGEANPFLTVERIE